MIRQKEIGDDDVLELMLAIDNARDNAFRALRLDSAQRRRDALRATWYALELAREKMNAATTEIWPIVEREIRLEREEAKRESQG